MAAISRRVVMLCLMIAANIAAQSEQTNSPTAIPNVRAFPPPGFEVISNRWKAKFGISLTWQPVPTNVFILPQQPPPAPPPPLWFNANLDTNFTVMETSNIVPHDAMEAWLLKEIEKDKLGLQETNLDMHSRWMLEQSLRQFQEQWNEHETQVESYKAFAEAIRSNPRSALTNMPDPITQALSLSVAHTESELADPTIDPYRRQALETILATFKQQLADHETNAQLWADLRLARTSGDPKRITHAKTELANYLAGRLGRIQGKKYPQGMSLDAIMAEYQKQANGSHWFNRHSIIRIILLVVFLVPPIAMIFIALKRRFSKPG